MHPRLPPHQGALPQLFEWHQWLESALYWIAVQPLNGEITVDDFHERLNGDRDPEHRTLERSGEKGAEECRPAFLAFGDGMEIRSMEQPLTKST
ncbi:hypothetical protein [Nonomuraea roseola]|uniref:Uncharacterized protein n=1 Tax=Nonomuraea roseola TaxID=46179 RepID=A0ABV5PQ03_9ACTN